MLTHLTMRAIKSIIDSVTTLHGQGRRAAATAFESAFFMPAILGDRRPLFLCQYLAVQTVYTLIPTPIQALIFIARGACGIGLPIVRVTGADKGAARVSYMPGSNPPPPLGLGAM